MKDTKTEEKIPIDDVFQAKFVALYLRFLQELDEYENDPYRRRDAFWSRDEHETFEGFMRWMRHEYI